jgi:hypothetical protein
LLALLAQEFGCGSNLLPRFFAFRRCFRRPGRTQPALDPQLNHRCGGRKKRRISMKKITAFLLSLILLLSFAGCAQEKPETTGQTVEFTFIAVDLEGNEKTFQITTNKSTVGEALMDEGLLAGEPGPYGLYVKSVLDQVLDYDTDKMYWSFYVNGEYGMTGVDLTPITEGESYMFKAESA